MLSIVGLYHTSPCNGFVGVHFVNCVAVSVLSQSFSLRFSVLRNDNGLLIGLLSDVPIAVTPFIVFRTHTLLTQGTLIPSFKQLSMI